jgi:hypothetical protein
MEMIDQITKVKGIVEEYFNQNAQHTGLTTIGEEATEHVIRIGTSILCTKWKIGYDGGSFVKSVVDNDLMKAVANADGTSIKALKFFVLLMHNARNPFN